MKNLRYILVAAALLIVGYSCEDRLNTSPTTAAGGDVIFSSASNAMTAMNGIYRLMYTYNWGSDWNHEHGGILAVILASDLMGEDRLINNPGSGWFVYDYTYGIGGDWTSTAGRQYATWNFFYSLITNANYIIANEGNIQDDADYANYVVGQAYAIRAYSYLWLVQSFSQCDPAYPGVPIYTEPTTPESEGAGRGTVQDVYTRINEDIDAAISRLENTSIVQEHPSHIDKGVAYGIKARAMMVQKRYPEALTAAQTALESTSATIVPFSQTSTVNDVNNSNVMWGLEIITDQSIANASVYAHMDADGGGTYSVAQHLISSWLYDQIPGTDARKAWWTAPATAQAYRDAYQAASDANDEATMAQLNASTAISNRTAYVQHKLIWKNAQTGTGDYILMRTEEMALIAAEAACHANDFTTAKTYLQMVTSQRDTDYAANMARYSDSKDITPETSSNMTTLMDYILFQRRVELWGEVSRIHDLKRLGLGVNRNYSYQPNNHQTNPSSVRAAINYQAGDYRFVYSIPLEEFNGNNALDPETDQNPFSN